LTEDGPHLLEIRNRHEQNLASSGFKVRFKSLAAQNAVDETVIDYTYDGLSRLIGADYGSDRSYAYQYDLAGNRTQQQTTIGMTTTTTNWTYDDANRMATMQIGSNPVTNFSYDANGNLTDDGVLTYSYDRANRVSSVNNGTYNTHFAYDGNGDRYQQTVGGTISNYLLDTQPGLAVVLQETTGADTLNYIHSPMGVHAVEETNDWHYMLDDGLGSVRGQVDEFADVVASQMYDPYGQPFDIMGTFVGDFGYAGEQIDSNGLSYNRARTYNPSLGAFTSLDPFEGVNSVPMSLNGYSYVHNNPVNLTDPNGELVIPIGLIVLAAVAAVVVAAVGVNTIAPDVNLELPNLFCPGKNTLPLIPPDIPNFETRFPSDESTFRDFIETYPDGRLEEEWREFIETYPAHQISWNNFLLVFPEAQQMWQDYLIYSNSDSLGSNEFGLDFKDKGFLDENPSITVIGQMPDVGDDTFHLDGDINTWWKTGRIPNRGLSGDGTSRVTWAENRKWLEDWIAKGTTFALVTPESELSTVYVRGEPNGFGTYQEIQYLRDNDIPIEDWTDILYD